MASSIRRVQPEAAIPGSAARRVGPKRQRDDGRRAFQDELADNQGKPASPAPRDGARIDSPVAPPPDDEAGARIDLLG